MVTCMLPSGRWTVPTIDGSMPSSSGMLPLPDTTAGHVFRHFASQLVAGGLAVSLSKRYSTKPSSSVTTAPILGIVVAISFAVLSRFTAAAPPFWSAAPPPLPWFAAPLAPLLALLLLASPPAAALGWAAW